MNSGYKLKEATWPDYFRLEALVRSRASCDYRPWDGREILRESWFLDPSKERNSKGVSFHLPQSAAAASVPSYPWFRSYLIPDSHFYVYYPKFLDRIEMEDEVEWNFLFLGGGFLDFMKKFHTVKGNEFDQRIFRRFCRLVSLIFNINLRSSYYLKIDFKEM